MEPLPQQSNVTWTSGSVKWQIAERLTTTQYEPFKRAQVDFLHAQILHNRGLQSLTEIQQFIQARYDQLPDPFALRDMSVAVQRIQRAFAGGEHITVYGDYDADGVTSSALLTRALRLLKPDSVRLDFYIPSRLKDGCGLNLPALDLLKARGTSLIITTDNASSDVEQVEYARTLGIDVIITDHHNPPDPLPAAVALINPWRRDCSSGERYLCGAGVAFKLVQALYRTFGRPVEEEQSLLDLVAIGTVADVANLLDENHTLVKLGLERLNTTTKPGLKALIQRANLRSGSLKEKDIAFALAPRLNAAGRMKDAGLAFSLLTTDNPTEAAAYVEELESLNQARQQQTEELMEQVRLQARERPDDSVLLVSGSNWSEGIIGLAAGRLAEELKKTVLVLSSNGENGLSRGSARSYGGFNLVMALRDFDELHKLARYGGHAQAAGFTIETGNIELLRDYLLNWKVEDKHINVDQLAPNGNDPLVEDSVIPPEVEPLQMIQVRSVDYTFEKLSSLNYQTYRKIRELGPFGAGNPEPVFKIERILLRGLRLNKKDGRNLIMELESAGGGRPLHGTMIRGGELYSRFRAGSHLSLIFSIEPGWSPTQGESTTDIRLKILHAEPGHASR